MPRQRGSANRRKCESNPKRKTNVHVDQQDDTHPVRVASLRFTLTPARASSRRMSDEPEPPRKLYSLKPREFEAVNEPRPNALPPATPTRDPGIVPATDAAIDVRALARQATGKGPALKGAHSVNRTNEVHAMLQDIHARADAAGLNYLAPKAKRLSRRKRDYWLLMLFGNLALVIVAIIGRSNPFVLVSSLAGVGLVSVAITWIMWHVMDDY